MLVIVASRYDEVARKFAASWQKYDAVLLTCQDLSTPGWCYPLGNVRCSTVIAEGRTVTQKEIRGVITRLPHVFEQELSHIVPNDRSYVAAEMTAFLRVWLSELPCPILNRPTPTCLSGPYWTQERWMQAAALVDIPVRPLYRRVGRDESRFPDEQAVQQPLTVTVTVVGEHCLGDVDMALMMRARQLASAANVKLLDVRFSSAEPDSFFVNASLWPDITIPAVADAIIAYFQRHWSQ